MNDSVVRSECAEKLAAAIDRPRRLGAFVGLDGFVDEIIHVVDKRTSAGSYHRIETITQFAKRLEAAAGQSANVELVNQRTKLGGNGPIMADALAALGLQVTYLGALGFPSLHPVFQSFAKRAQVFSIGEAAHTDALEFEDGKILLGKLTQLSEINWANIQARFGRERFAEKLKTSDLVAFVNWTMIPCMSDIWKAVLAEGGLAAGEPKRRIFFDLADPEKRPAGDIRSALELIAAFERYFQVTLGLNEKEALEVAAVLDLPVPPRKPAAIVQLAQKLRRQIGVHTVVIHPVSYAAAACGEDATWVEGPFTAQPLITTGAGDHFNAGFCVGQLLGLTPRESLLTGVATSGYYVRTAQSPTLKDLAKLLGGSGFTE